jgi:jumonji domain-containing protein 7
VPPSITFADDALEKAPDAINFWLGNQRSVTALHKDNYENIYVQVRGTKHFTLLPPTEMPCVNETLLLGGRYHLKHDDGSSDELMIVMDEDENPFPVAMWDPDEPEACVSPYSQYSKPLRIILQEGDMLYLPAMWYHKVAQECGDEGFACSVNYW